MLQFPVLMPEANPSGKLLDMETAVFGRSAYPAEKHWHWEGKSDLKEGPDEKG